MSHYLVTDSIWINLVCFGRLMLFLLLSGISSGCLASQRQPTGHEVMSLFFIAMYDMIEEGERDGKHETVMISILRGRRKSQALTRKPNSRSRIDGANLVSHFSFFRPGQQISTTIRIKLSFTKRRHRT
eukprot:scaffold1182_cov165-Amphora_coffeaeformis.AAC.12